MLTDSNFCPEMPITMKSYLVEKVGELSDFTFKHRMTDTLLYISPTTNIEVSFSFEPDGVLMAIWFPDAEEDPSYSDHQLFLENSLLRLN